MDKIIKWFKKSNRYKHLIYGAICSIVVFLFFVIVLPLITNIYLNAAIITILIISALAIGMEFKDKLYGNKFDITDILSTVIMSILILIIVIIKIIL